MVLGKSIRIYLKDGSITGIKFGEVVNQTIQSISCPRNRIQELFAYSESKRPGIYFLFGFDDISGEPKAYIGEAENVYSRLQDHLAKKDFWNEVVIIVSKDENLTKSHVKYLESKCVQLAFHTKRQKLDNFTQPVLTSLPPADRDAMEEFLIYVKLLLGVFGHKLLEELTIQIRPQAHVNPNGDLIVQDTTTSSEVVSKEQDKLYLNIAGMTAKALNTNEGIVVLKGSEATNNPAPSLSPGYTKLREKLIADGILKLDGNKYYFQSDYLFNTASPAASVVLGYSINGRESWKNKLGDSLKAIESKMIKTE